MAQNEFTDFEIALDLTEQDSWGGEYAPPIPPGDYILTVVNIEQRNAKSSNNPMLAVTFVVAEGEYVDRKVFNNYPLSPKALGRLKQLMLACKTELGRVVASQFIGQSIRATVIHTEGEGTVDANGNPQPGRVFANVINEAPLEEAAPQPKAAAKTPPVINATAGAAKPKTNSTTPRRA